MHTPRTITGKPFFFDSSINSLIQTLDAQVRDMWANGELSPQLLLEMYQQAKIDELYHSNKIEGNSLTYGETVEIVQANKEIQGKPFRDQQEARNLSSVLDYAHRIGADKSVSVTQNELRRIHSLLLRSIQSDAGMYRTTQIEISGSRFSPPEAFEVPRHMTQLSDFVKHVTDPDTRYDHAPIFSAAAAHVWLAQIHPFIDGNGRTARALMNLILMRRGYPPCIITEEDRPRYLDALEASWESGDLTSFIELIYENVNEHRKDRGWLRSVLARLKQTVSQEMESEYLIWRNAMTHLKSQFRHTVDNLNAMNLRSQLQLRFVDYGELDVAKYDALRGGMPTTKTRYFGIEVAGPAKRQLYVFFHVIANEKLRERAQVALMIMKGLEPDDMRTDKAASAAIPDIYQVGFDLVARTFVISDMSGISERNPQQFAQQFFDEFLPRDLKS